MKAARTWVGAALVGSVPTANVTKLRSFNFRYLLLLDAEESRGPDWIHTTDGIVVSVWLIEDRTPIRASVGEQ